jgi:hypothetical protein
MEMCWLNALDWLILFPYLLLGLPSGRYTETFPIKIYTYVKFLVLPV